MSSSMSECKRIVSLALSALTGPFRTCASSALHAFLFPTWADECMKTESDNDERPVLHESKFRPHIERAEKK